MDIETHPFEPWLPSNAKLLLLGTFPPAPKRWCMEWYYPNYTNDMWRIFGYVFFEDKKYFVDEANKTYKLDLLRTFLKDKGICLNVRQFWLQDSWQRRCLRTIIRLMLIR